MVLLAFSLQDQIEKWGAYVGIVSFFGLAILSLLYFAQAREVKRLREWAGRAPERAAEVEAMAVAHAEEARKAPAPVAQPAPAVAAPAVAVPANGTVELAPAEVAALAFARAAGVHTPHPPRPHPVPVAAAVPATEVAAAGAATAAGDAAAVQDLAPATNGHGSGAVAPPPPAGVPAPATPAARRAEAPGGAVAASAAPLRQTPPPRRPAPPPRRPIPPGRPARRESSARTIALTAVVAVVVLGAAAFAITRVFSSGGSSPAKPPKVAGTTPAPSPSGTATATPPATPALTKATMKVAVYNGTTVPGLAGTVRQQLGNLGYNQSNLGAATYTPNQQRQASVVMYERGDRPAAASVAKSLSISDVRLIDSATQQLIDQSGKKWDVVVIVGADKSQ